MKTFVNNNKELLATSEAKLTVQYTSLPEDKQNSFDFTFDIVPDSSACSTTISNDIAI